MKAIVFSAVRIICLFLLIWTVPAYAQDTAYAVLKTTVPAHTPTSFYISDIHDGRADTSTVGIRNGRTPVVIIGGISTPLKSIIAPLEQDRSQTPVTISVTKLRFYVHDKGGETSMEESIGFTFSAGGLKLIELDDSGVHVSGDASLDNVDVFIRQSLANSLKDFDKWWPEQKNKVPVSADVKVIAKVGQTTDDKDLIAYSATKPLSIPDFNGPYPDDNKPEMAETSSGIGLNLSTEVVDGQLVLNIVLTPFFNKNESWFKPDGKTPQVLAHEQAHFDITAIKTCELYQAILKTTFTKETYNQVITQIHGQCCQ